MHQLIDFILRYRRVFSVVAHALMVVAANLSAFWLRFDGEVPPAYWDLALTALPWLVGLRLLTFLPLRLFEGMWKYTSLWDLRNIILGIAISSALFVPVATELAGEQAYPRSIFIIDAVLLLCLMTGARLTRRIYGELVRGSSGGRRVLIYGAGDAGEMIVRDMRQNRDHKYEPIGFVDDDHSKVGFRIHGVPVLGTRDDLPRLLAKLRPDEVLMAIPRANPEVFRSVVRMLERHDVPIKTLPNLKEILDGRVEVSQIRNLAVQDLLARGPVGLDTTPIRRLLKGRRVLVTGAGGSIGSELCRQIARFDVAALTLFDHAENGLFHALNDLADRGASSVARAVVGDVTDRQRVEQVFAEHAPEIVFHAAAHKHVPLMEANVCEAVKNNVTGTRVVAETAERFGVDRFILISTDKAVNPASVMGVTKRVAELMLLTTGAGSGTSFMTVRFGNVLGSAGSVVPRFMEQIKAGGPVTVTHPEMRRFFMLIPEAVQLVLHAAAHGESGKLYVLQMGDEVNIADMARHLIRLAGYVPDTEIPIAFTGLRPGEKLNEELVGPDERTEQAVENVMHVRPVTKPDGAWLARERARLEEAAARNDAEATLACLGHIVPAFEASRQALASASGATVATARPEAAAPSAARAPAAARAAVGLTCPKCGLPNLVRSQARTRLEQWRKRVSRRRPYRCHACGWRDWLEPVEPPAGETASAATGLPGQPDPRALDATMGTRLADDRPAFSPRNLPTP